MRHPTTWIPTMIRRNATFPPSDFFPGASSRVLARFHRRQPSKPAQPAGSHLSDRRLTSSPTLPPFPPNARRSATRTPFCLKKYRPLKRPLPRCLRPPDLRKVSRDSPCRRLNNSGNRIRTTENLETLLTSRRRAASWSAVGLHR
jgi:hypothetical protein